MPVSIYTSTFPAFLGIRMRRSVPWSVISREIWWISFQVDFDVLQWRSYVEAEESMFAVVCWRVHEKKQYPFLD